MNYRGWPYPRISFVLTYGLSRYARRLEQRNPANAGFRNF